MMKLTLQFCAVLALLVSIASCSDDSESSPVISFETSASTVDEDASTVTVSLVLSKAASKDVTGTLSLSGTAALNGDYSIEDLSFTIPEGETSLDIDVDIIDEDLLEADPKELVIELTDVSGASVGQNGTFTLTIHDNEEYPGEGELQIDLSWTAGEGVDIDKADLDLWILSNVVFDEDNNIEDADYYVTSENELGFESIRLAPDDPDQDYYIAVFYYEGTVDVDFTLTLNSVDWDNQMVGGSFDKEDVDYYTYFLDPIVKSGNDYTVGDASGKKSAPRFFKKLDARSLRKLKASGK